MKVTDNKNVSSTRTSPFNWSINGVQILSRSTVQTARIYTRVGWKFSPRSEGKVGPYKLTSVLSINEQRTEIQPRVTSAPSVWTYSGKTHRTNNPAYYFPYASGYEQMATNTTNLCPITSAQLTELCNSVLDDAMGNIKPGVSLLVDLAEIGQTIALVTSVKGLLSIGPKILRQRFDSPVLGRNMVSTVKNRLHRYHVYDAVNADLAYKFGVKPLIDSIQGLAAWEDEVTRRLAILAQRNANPGLTLIRRRLRQNATSEALPADGLRVVRNYSRNLAVAGAWCDATYNINTRSAVELTKQYLGLNRLANAAWNLIPFSFVVDWVLRVGNLAETIDKALQPFQHGLTVGRATLYHPWYSEKASVSNLYCLKKAASSSYPAFEVYQQVNTESYKRTPGFIYSPGLISGSGFDAWRLGTAGELAFQLTRK